MTTASKAVGKAAGEAGGEAAAGEAGGETVTGEAGGEAVAGEAGGEAVAGEASGEAAGEAAGATAAGEPDRTTEQEGEPDRAATMKKVRGLRALVEDAVEHGSRAVERVHLATARRTFTILESIPPIAAPARLVHALYDASTGATYASVRLVNRAVGALAEFAIDTIESLPASPGPDAINEGPPAPPALDALAEDAPAPPGADALDEGR